MQLAKGALLHIRFAGQSSDIPLAELGLSVRASDAEIKRALARRFDVAEARLHDYVVDRHPTGNLTVRPEAVFG